MKMKDMLTAVEEDLKNESPFDGNQDFVLETKEEPVEYSVYKSPMPSTDTQTLVNERGKTHGDFADHARITQLLKDVIKIELVRRHQRGQPKLTSTQKESIDMILHKIGRVVAGEAGFQDHWDDIAGYAKIARADV